MLTSSDRTQPGPCLAGPMVPLALVPLAILSGAAPGVPPVHAERGLTEHPLAGLVAVLTAGASLAAAAISRDDGPVEALSLIARPARGDRPDQREEGGTA